MDTLIPDLIAARKAADTVANRKARMRATIMFLNPVLSTLAGEYALEARAAELEAQTLFDESCTWLTA